MEGPLQGKAVEKPQVAQGANDAQGASDAQAATPPDKPALSLHEINIRLTRTKGIIKEMIETKTPQPQVDEFQKIIDDLELKKQAAIPPQERLADMDQEIKDLQWYKEQEE